MSNECLAAGSDLNGEYWEKMMLSAYTFNGMFTICYISKSLHFLHALIFPGSELAGSELAGSEQATRTF